MGAVAQLSNQFFASSTLDLLQVVVLAAGVNDFANATLDATSHVAGGVPGSIMPLYQWLDEYEGLVREVS